MSPGDGFSTRPPVDRRLGAAGIGLNEAGTTPGCWSLEVGPIGGVTVPACSSGNALRKLSVCFSCTSGCAEVGAELACGAAGMA